MSDVLATNVFVVKELVGMFKASSNYDIFDAGSGQAVLTSREENLNALVKILRFTDYKRMTPFNVVIRTMDGRQIARVKRGISIFLSNVTVHGENDEVIGGFKQKFFSIGGAFGVHDAAGNEVFQLKGKWTGWDFRFMAGEQELAHVTKKWAGMGRELFTSADNYVLRISDTVPPNSPARRLILAAVMCIDMVLKE